MYNPDLFQQKCIYKGITLKLGLKLHFLLDYSSKITL